MTMRDSDTSTPTPAPKGLVDVLEGLLGREIAISEGEPVVSKLKSPAAIAVYTDANLGLRAVITLDLALAASAGCALGLLPAALVSTAVEEKALPGAVVENLHEVLNVMTSVFNVPGAPHLSLSKVVSPGDAVPSDVAVLTRTMGKRLDLWIDVHGYQRGGLSVVCA
jgi:hypothetical protein